MKPWPNRLASAALGVVFTASLTWAATDLPGLLIVGNDSDPGALSRQDSGFRNLSSALAGEMLAWGFRIFDESAVHIEGPVEGGSGWPENGTMEASLATDFPSINYVLVVSVYSDVRQLAYATTIEPRIRGQFLTMPSGELVGTLDVRLPGPIYASVDCDQPCLSRVVSDQSTILAASFGEAFAEKFEGMGIVAAGAGADGGKAQEGEERKAPLVYRLSFSGFSSEEIAEVEEYLAAFGGYAGHEDLGIAYGGETISYKTRTSLTELESNLRRMLLYLAHEGDVVRGAEGLSVDKRGRANAD